MKAEVVTVAVGAGAGALTTVGILDHPTLVIWLLVGSILGGMVSLAIWEHDLVAGVPRSFWGIAGQFFTGAVCGFLLTPLAVMEWRPEGPWTSELIGAASLILAMMAWKVLKLAGPLAELKIRQRLALFFGGESNGGGGKAND